MAERRSNTTKRSPSTASSLPGGALVVVESPKKARTLQSILGGGYRVEASFGHVRDLPADRLAVDVEHDFAPEYVPVPKAAARLAALRKAAAGASDILLATDPDREGEAIAWHLATALRLREGRYARVTFHEITATAVRRAFQERRALDMALVNAQQARRVLDRLVGYRLSPLLWTKVQKGISAGRVQSVALRLIVEREREIRAFVPKEYWTIDARLAPAATRGNEDAFTARLMTADGKKAEIGNESDANATTANLKASQFTVEGSGQKTREVSPAPPFTTSTLQQTAASRLKMPAKRTMDTAQSLFEGSYITYHRTDSVQVSEEALAAARQVIGQQFPPEYLPPSARRYRTRTRNAQEAHEAIRPVDPARTPDALRGQLSGDEARLYDLVWRRFIASQMAAARYSTDELRVLGQHPQHRYGLRAAATVLVFPGYLAIYGQEAGPVARSSSGSGRAPAAREDAPEGARPLDDAAADSDAEAMPDNERLPKLEATAALRLLGVAPTQHFTEPPPRYSEGTLIRVLEAAGVGRPSTYAAIVSTIQERGYVVRDRQVFLPTALGEAANDFLVAHFPGVVSLPFTASMEDDLDRVAAGEIAWTEVLRRFYGPFAAAVGAAQGAAAMTVADETPRAAVEAPAKGRSRRPKRTAEWAGVAHVEPKGSRRTRTVKASSKAAPAPAPADGHDEAPVLPDAAIGACPECGGALVQRTGKYGAFVGCSQYPRCRYVQRDSKQPAPVRSSPARKGRAASGRSTAGNTSGGARRGGRAGADTVNRRTARKEAGTVPATIAARGTAGAPECPQCGAPMTERTQRATGQVFWGCSTYPKCRGTRPLSPPSSGVSLLD